MLNIKNRETEQAVRELADRLDLSLTETIAVAVRHEMQRLDADRDGYIQQLREAAQRVQAERDPRDWLSDEMLYDADGLPR